jgi:predicted unusual protein kinase regulating ubiquinone biosynthesis (AarF/ABC1/UbiB family)
MRRSVVANASSLLNNFKTTADDYSPLLAFALEFGVRRDALRQSSAELGRWAAQRVPKLGLAYVKCGQLVSTRPDVFDPDFCAQLASLRDNVAPLPYSTIAAAIDEGPQAFLDAVDSVEPVPLASASVAQVHRAKLRTGEEVIVKVRRPGIVDGFQREIQNVRRILNIMASVNMDGAAEAMSLLDDLEQHLLAEVDLSLELANLQDFRQAYGGNDASPIRIPKPYPELSNEKLLVLEYLPGVPLDRAIDKLNMDEQQRRSTATMLCTCFLLQLVQGGIIHTDAHGGNLALHPETRQLILYDYGSVLRLEPAFRASLKRAFVLLIDKDVEGIIDVLPSIGVRVHDRAALRSWIRSYLCYLDTLDVSSLATSAASALNGGGSNGSRAPATSGPQMVAILRVLSLLEGSCRSLCSSFSYGDVWPLLMVHLLFDRDYVEYKAQRDGEVLRRALSSSEGIIRLLAGQLSSSSVTIDGP